jgi:hypothetical protein
MAETKTKSVVKKTAITEDSIKKAAAKPRAKKAENILSDKDRYEMIQYAAYFIAERNGFVGDPHAFWNEAEAQINNTKP